MKDKRLTILTFYPYYLPGFKSGGPVKTLANMVSRLGDELDFFIVTSDRDFGDKDSYPNIFIGPWNQVGKAHVLYLNKDKISIIKLNKILSEVRPDLIYLNSFFDPAFTQRVLWLRRINPFWKIPIILAPRGEFSEGALSIKKGKKTVYMKICTFFRLYEGLIWQASSVHERVDILRKMPTLTPDRIRIAMNLASLSNSGAESRIPRPTGGALRVCFLSRISRMKNLDFALLALSNVKSNILFTIYGPIEELDYWEKCKTIMKSLPRNIKVVYDGPLLPIDVSKSLAKNDLLFLPTLGENYGHVIYEALSVGVPVLISNRTPWKDIREKGVGWEFSLESVEQFSETIDQVAGWPHEIWESMSNKALQYASNMANDNDIIRDNLNIFMYAVEKNLKRNPRAEI